MPSYKYQPQREVLLKSFQIKNLLDFRNTRSRFRRKTYDFSTKPQCTLSPNEWVKLRIDRISQETHNSKRFLLSLPNGIDQALNLPICSYFNFRGYDISKSEQNEVIKKYTPISDSLYDGFIEFVIKYYKNGELTPYLFNLNEGDYIEINGAIINNKLQYPFSDKSNIGMIAGGTGITPMIQILKEMTLHSQYDTRYVELLYANQTIHDYLCQADLMSLKSIMKQRLNIYDFFEYTEHKKILLPNSWNPNIPQIGRIDLNSMKKLLPKPSDDTLIMLCGTKGMKQLMYGANKDDGTRELNGYLSKLGYTEQMIHVF